MRDAARPTNPVREGYQESAGPCGFGRADKNDSFCQECASFASDRWFSLRVKYLRIEMTIDNSLLFEDFALYWTL